MTTTKTHDHDHVRRNDDHDDHDDHDHGKKKHDDHDDHDDHDHGKKKMTIMMTMMITRAMLMESTIPMPGCRRKSQRYG